MSIQYGSSLADEVAGFAQSNLIASYCDVASATLVIYDHLCTLDKEWDLVWKRRFSSATLLFCMNRWLILALTILDMVPLFVSIPYGSRWCQRVLRVCQRRLSGSNLSGDWPTMRPILRCFLEYEYERYGDRCYAYAVLCMSIVEVGTRMHNIKSELMWMLFRDVPANDIEEVFVDASAFSTPLSSIVITHFMLNLRKLTSYPSESTGTGRFSRHSEEMSQDRSVMDSLVFVGNMGELLDHDSNTDDLDIAWEGYEDERHEAEEPHIEMDASLGPRDTPPDSPPKSSEGSCDM
ncbi:hypothetical protein CERSUDRAFT_74756 [Gelatoporia subvermispora B]|uniref:DUF6533 domain-containing protein n=1 Tax=Ceriporiopsis subvermispora (strain B) TaxID=914234 RepID=M2QV77_CERS8|nr:hypothetical protein CERSUDRAFT_74756 [Gelatoporia subvermispora B]